MRAFRNEINELVTQQTSKAPSKRSLDDNKVKIPMLYRKDQSSSDTDCLSK